MKRGSSLRFIECPMPHISGEVRVVMAPPCRLLRVPLLRVPLLRVPYAFHGACDGAACSVCRRLRRLRGGLGGRALLLRRVAHRFDDVYVAGAAAEVARDGLAD